VGRQLTDLSWVKTVTHSEDGETRVVTALGKGFDVRVQRVTIQKACMRLTAEYGWGGAFAIKLQDIKAEQIEDAQEPPETVENVYHDDESYSPRKYKRSFCFDREQFDEAETYIFAFNGVIMNPETAQGQKIVSHINKLIALKKRVVFVTNDSTMSRKSFYERITKKYGVQLQESECMQDTMSRCSRSGFSDVESSQELSKESVVTSSFTCAWFLKSAGIRRPFVIGYGTGLLDELEAAGISDYYATVDSDGRTSSNA